MAFEVFRHFLSQSVHMSAVNKATAAVNPILQWSLTFCTTYIP